MEENVALDSSKQKQFVKSIKGIQKRIKKNDTDKNFITKAQKGEIRKRKRQPRGLVYLGHIPHGFYEHEMTQYFKQFGVVTNVRVIRSKRTGRSKGHAFVEFKDPAVAEIVAETMNNYLMGKRLIKAACIPPEKQRRFAQRKHWSAVHNPTNEVRMKEKKAYNANMDKDGELKKATKMLSTFLKTKKKLNELGINYDFFTPVDVPEVLLKLLVKPDMAHEKLEVNDDDDEKKNKTLLKQNNKVEKVLKNEKVNKKSEKSQKNVKLEQVTSNKKQKKIKETIVSKEQKNKEQKLQDAGVKSVENFIKINKENSESDSEYEFDSDEFDKMLENEADNDSELESAEEESEDEETEEKNLDPEGRKDNKAVTLKNKKNKKNMEKAKKQISEPKSSQKVKRKANEESVIALKKSKFENKNTQKLNKKQFKKRK